MKFTLSWLHEFLDTDASLDTISHTLTAIGLEVENITDAAKDLQDFTVAEILEAEKHPNADKLKICKVDTGAQIVQIVCGGPNARAGIKVILASVGALIPNGGFKIKQSKIREVESCGMMCSANELNIGGDAAGIVELPENAEVGKPFAPFMGLDDPLIEIAITPNRGDCLGVYGIARDLAAAGLGTLKAVDATDDAFQKILDKGTFESPIGISIEDEALCSYFIGRSFKNVRNGQSPAWLKQRLESIGLKPISVLVDITNYITFGFGRPAHVFDAAKLQGDLVVRAAKKGEILRALDDKEYTLDSAMVVVADTVGAQALGGIMGGADSGVSEETTEVFLEIALFDPIITATTGRKLQIESDARYRFERTVSAATLKYFITASQLIEELCGGQASKPVVAGSVPMERVRVAFRVARVNELIGLDVSKARCIEILESLGFAAEDKGELLDVGIPSFRPDVRIEEDVVEEIARIIGYDMIPVVDLPVIDRTKPAVNKNLMRLSNARRGLASRGLDEVMSFSFMAKKQAALFAEGQELVALANPISSDLGVMTPSLLPNLIDAVRRNAARGFNDVAFFESAMIFHGQACEQQEPAVTAIRAGNNMLKNIHNDFRAVDVFDAKADAFEVLAAHGVGVENLRISRDVPSYFHPGKSGALMQGKNVLAYFGEIHPKIAKAMDVKTQMVACEVFVGRVPQAKPKKTMSKGKLVLSNFQAVERDFAFIVNDNVAASDVVLAVKKAEKKLLEQVHVFDIYSGKGVEDGKKSVALSVRLQPKDRTLTDDEIQNMSNAIIQNVQKSTGGMLR